MKMFRSYQLAKEVYLEIKKLELQNPEKDQIIRAGLSIPLNLAEGSTRTTVKDKTRFYSIAFGSLRECQAVLEMSEIESRELQSKLDQLAGMIYKLIKNIQESGTRNQSL